MLVRVRRAGYEVTLKVDDSRMDEVIAAANKHFGGPNERNETEGIQPETGSRLHAGIQPKDSRRKPR